MNIRRLAHPLLMLCFLILTSCGSGGDDPDPNTPTRSFSMGFTPWPYEATVAATEFVYSEIGTRGDIIAHHLDGGIPWQEALDDTAYPTAVEAELNARAARALPGQRVYLAVSPFNRGRTDLADYWGTANNQPLPAAWAARGFDSNEVITAYTHFASNLITRFEPDYFNLGIEASELAINDSAKFDAYVTFTQQVADALHRDFPNVKLMISIGMKSPDSAAATTINTQLPRVAQYIDVVGASIYPYVYFDHADKGNPATLPANWLSQLQNVANGKPIAVTETGWIAERLVMPTFSVDIPADVGDQDAYLNVLFDQLKALNAEFVIWFALVDYDTLWRDTLNQDEDALTWRDTGLYDGNLNPRPALGTWQGQLAIDYKANN